MYFVLSNNHLVNTGAIPRVDVGADFKHDTSEDVTLRCFWERRGNLSNIEYEAQWYGDAKDLLPKIEAKFTGLQSPEFLFQPEILNGTRNNIGYKFHKLVSMHHAIFGIIFP
jgi:hypothetical protein